MARRKKKAAQPVAAPKQDTPEVVSGADCKGGWLKPCVRHAVHRHKANRRTATRGARFRKELATY
jgi:hypothetical protein